MICWHIVTADEYRNGTPQDGHMYFLSDTHEIYRGSDPFTESVIMYTGTLPTVPALNRLYINSETLEGKIWQGAAIGWKTVINAISDEVTDTAGVGVSGKAVVGYVAAELAKMATAEGSVSALSWDSAEHLLTVTKGDDSTETVLFDGLGVSLEYSVATGELKMLDHNGTALGNAVKLDLERFVSSGEYNVNEKAIYLYFDAEKTDYVTIPVEDLVDIYKAEGSASLDLSVTGNTITGAVKISTAAGNLITIDENGLYVAPIDISGKMDKVTDGVEGNILVVGADGQAVDSGKSFEDLGSNSKVYVGTSIDEAVAGNTPVEHDICIVRAEIGEGTGKYQHTAYVYNGTNWEAMDGNYSAANVFFPEDLSTTTAIGNFKLTNGQATIPAKGKNLIDVWNSIYVKESNPSTTQPSVTMTLNKAGAYEVGSVVETNYSASLNAGKYTYGPATGVTASSWEVTNSDGGSSTEPNGAFDSITVTDDTNYTVSATATYGDGAIPVTNTGNDYAAGQIKAGSKSKTSSAITGYRNMFYGCLTTKTELTSAVIRGLSKSGAAVASGHAFDMTIPVGTLRTVIAVPASVGVTALASVIDNNGMMAQINTAFLSVQVDVEGTNGYQAVPYVVFYEDASEPSAKENIYSVTL